MKNAVDTLFYKIQNDPFLYDGGRVLYMNAQFHTDLDMFKDGGVDIQQHFKPHAQTLMASGFDVAPVLPDADGAYDLVLLLLPKNIIEAKYMMACAIRHLSEGGAFVCAADNRAGGTRIKKLLQDFGFQNIEQDSRNKARVVCARKSHADETALDKAIAAGAQQQILEARFISQPGVFGWHKIDTGSAMLTHHLPDDIKGDGADFGCGYGYLSDYLLSKNKVVKSLLCVDADYRALTVCEKNLEQYERRKKFIWSDLTMPQSDIEALDFIIMNPPFHEGKNPDSDIGVSFIKTAAGALRKGGRLFMVANRQLAYEDVLKNSFAQVKNRYEGDGFKVFEAIK